jgi:PAS domain S-box-containing protein
MSLPYEQYFENMPCYLSVQDKDLKIVQANRLFRDSFGDIEGRYCYQVYKQRPEKCLDCPVERTFRDGLSHRSEEMVKTLDGREVSVIVYTTPIYDDDGKIASVMEMSTDITEIKQLQNQLSDSRQKYRLLFEDVPCYISIQDRDLRIVEANRMHRESFGSYYGCKCYEVYKHRSEACVPCTVLQTFDDGQIHVHEEVVCSKDDRRINVLVTTAPILNADGEVEHVIEMSADITQIRQLQDKLTSAGMLISSISHSIKGLLNSLDGGIYLVDTGLKKNDTARINKGWEMAMRNVDRIRSMVLNILYYAKDREPNYETVIARDLVATLKEDFTRKATEMGVKLDVLTDGDGAFEADPHAVKSMLINLLENSMDACRIDRNKDDHVVTLGCCDGDDHVVFEVTDNGIGMDRQTREKAFSMFFSSKGAAGTGLGLFIANKIAQGHGGEIKVESEEGKGTKFMVTLPKVRVAQPDEASANISESPE